MASPARAAIFAVADVCSRDAPCALTHPRWPHSRRRGRPQKKLPAPLQTRAPVFKCLSAAATVSATHDPSSVSSADPAACRVGGWACLPLRRRPIAPAAACRCPAPTAPCGRLCRRRCFFRHFSVPSSNHSSTIGVGARLRAQSKGCGHDYYGGAPSSGATDASCPADAGVLGDNCRPSLETLKRHQH